MSGLAYDNRMLCYIRGWLLQGLVQSEARRGLVWGSPALQKCGLIARDQIAKRPMNQLFIIVGISYVVLDVSDSAVGSNALRGLY